MKNMGSLDGAEAKCYVQATNDGVFCNRCTALVILTACRDVCLYDKVRTLENIKETINRLPEKLELGTPLRLMVKMCSNSLKSKSRDSIEFCVVQNLYSISKFLVQYPLARQLVDSDIQAYLTRLDMIWLPFSIKRYHFFDLSSLVDKQLIDLYERVEDVDLSTYRWIAASSLKFYPKAVDARCLKMGVLSLRNFMSKHENIAKYKIFEQIIEKIETALRNATEEKPLSYEESCIKKGLCN